jgi:hypothetical protein
MRFVPVACYTYNKIGLQNRVKYVSHPTALDLLCTIQTTMSYKDNGPFLSTRELLYCLELALGCCWTNLLVSHVCDLKASYANLTRHSVQQVQVLYSIAVRWQTCTPDLDQLSRYGRDDPLQLISTPST